MKIYRIEQKNIPYQKILFFSEIILRMLVENLGKWLFCALDYVKVDVYVCLFFSFKFVARHRIIKAVSWRKIEEADLH